MPVVGHVGSDYERLRSDFRVIANPFDPAHRVMLVPPIRPDVALIHALAADREGTLLLEYTEDDALLARASRTVIASAERIVPIEEIRRAPEGVVLESIDVTAVVELPGGAHPTLVRGLAPVDAAHLREYVEAARDEERLRDYLSRYVFGPKDHATYLGLVE